MPEQTMMEVYLSEESAQKRNEELNKMVEVDIAPEDSPFQEKILFCMMKLDTIRDEHKVFSFMESRNLLPEKVAVKESDFIVKERKLKSQGLDVLCEATPEEYNGWVFDTLEGLFMYCETPKENTMDIEHIHFWLGFLLESKEAREKKQKESAN